MVAEGQEAPDFELTSDSGEKVRLSSLRGKPVVLYFYPRSDTPGCTRQASAIRDSWESSSGGRRRPRGERRPAERPGALQAEVPPPVHDPRRPRGNRCCRRRPSAPPRAAWRAGAHDAAGDHVRRREREAEVRGGEDHRGAGALGGEALRRVHLDDPAAHRPDDPPAADVGAERDRGAAETITPVGTSTWSRGCRWRRARA
jgi:hypothetical protein